MALHILLDTAREEDALACGYEAAISHENGGLKIVADLSKDFHPSVDLYSYGGEVTVVSLAEIDQVIRALQMAKGLNERASVSAAGDL